MSIIEVAANCNGHAFAKDKKISWKEGGGSSIASLNKAYAAYENH